MEEQGNAIEVNDPLLPVIQQVVQNSKEGENRVEALWALRRSLVTKGAGRVVHEAVKEAYQTLLAEGAKVTLAKYASKVK